MSIPDPANRLLDRVTGSGRDDRFKEPKYRRPEKGEMTMTASVYNKPSTAQDEADIRRLIAAWSRALEAKDVDGLTSDYAPDAVLFDAIPPYKTVGADNIRNVWDNCLPYFPDTFKSEHRDITVHVDGDIALVHCLHHFVPTPADHPCGMTWMRVTACYRRLEGQWKVVHEHVSLPFNPMNNQAWLIANPDVLDMPSYDAPPDACQS
jgi:uncharacterized protein (TIGR02246 family)